MSIQDDDNQSNKNQQTKSTGSSTMSSAFASAGASRQQNQAQAPRVSLLNLGRLSQSPISKTVASETLTKLEKALAAVYSETNDKNFDFVLIPIDKDTTTTLAASVLIIAGHFANDASIVAYHTLVIEAASEPIAPKFETVAGQPNIEILRTIGDTVDQFMAAAVSDAVIRQFPNSKIVSADNCVVPETFNVADVGLVRMLGANAGVAIWTEINIHTKDFQDLSCMDIDTREASLVAKPTFNHTNQALDAVGQPVRSDVLIEFTAAPTNQPQGQAVMRVAPLAAISGFMDLCWDPAQPVTPPMAFQYAPQQQQAPQLYTARFVMTALESKQLLTLPMQLLSLATAMTLQEGNTWANAFKPSGFSGNGIDPHDIGVIGVEANFTNDPNGGIRIDTKSSTFGPDKFVSLDVPEVGDSTWYNGVFAAAAENNASANQMIIDAANYLTGGNFGKYFPSNGKVAVDENNRIHLGYYTDRHTGTKRDLRDIDYLAVANLVGEREPGIIKDWSDTFERTDYPLALRLANRKKIIQNLCPDAVFTGFARRVTFETAFLRALAQGIHDTGLEIRAVQPYMDMQSYQRATNQFAQQTLMDATPTGLFNRGYGQTNVGQMGNSRTFGQGGSRW